MRLLAALAALTLVAAGCGDGGSAPATGDGGATKLKVQETAGVASSFVAFGIEKGMFGEQKLDVDLQPTQGGAATIPALVSGDIQVGGSNVVSLLLGASKGLPIRVIAGGTVAKPSGKDFGAIVVGKDSKVRGVEALAGKTIAVNTLDNVAEVVVKASLDEQGVDPGSLKLVEVPFPEMQPALEKGSIDAAFSIEPFVTQTVQKGGRAIDYSYVETEPEMQIGAYAVTDRFAAENADVVDRYAKAIAETAAYVGDHQDEFRAFLSEAAKIPPAVAERITLPQWTGEVDAASVAKTAELMEKYGLADGPIDASKLLEGGS
jgi:NitT/TauT family transport system substrate-binding protein